jgi:hypothetical protein
LAFTKPWALSQSAKSKGEIDAQAWMIGLKPMSLPPAERVMTLMSSTRFPSLCSICVSCGASSVVAVPGSIPS